MIELKEPVRAKKSDRYLAVLTDANKISHFWNLDGSYDGWDHVMPKRKKTCRPKRKG